MTQLFTFKKQYPQVPPDQETAAKIIQLAKAINVGTSGNHASKASWYEAMKRLAEQDRQKGETSEQAFARYIGTDDGRELFNAYKSANGPDFQPVAPEVPVVKAESAYARLKKIAADIRAENPELSEGAAFVRAYNENRELAELSKRESAFA